MAKEYLFTWLAILSTILTIAYAAQHSNGNVSSHFENGQAEKNLPYRYFDLTDVINQGDWEQVEKAMNQTARVYYSTDLLITDILQLSDIAAQINTLTPSNDTIKSSPCIVVAFQMTVNRSDIDWRHIEDVLYLSPQTDNNDNYKDRLKVMKQHLCGVVLDFQLGGLGHDEFTNYRDPFRYSHEWNLSFIKYTKKILKSIFGNDIEIPVGVTINEHQVRAAESSEILFQQEIHFADFLMVNLEFSPLSRMPLDYSPFEEEFLTIRSETERLLKKDAATNGSGDDLGNVTRHFLSNGTRNVSMQNVIYMVSWVEQCPSEYNNGHGWAYNAVLKSSQAEYFGYFQAYASVLLLLRVYRVGVISGSYLTFERKQCRDHCLRPSRIVPYLHIHDVDVTSCQLGFILNRISHFDDVVVNEFTWNALVHNEEKLQYISSQNCRYLKSLKTPKKALLLATKGIGAHWNTTQEKFKSFVRQHSSVVGINLTTIVFSAEDVKSSTSNDDDPYRYMW